MEYVCAFVFLIPLTLILPSVLFIETNMLRHSNIHLLYFQRSGTLFNSASITVFVFIWGLFTSWTHLRRKYVLFHLVAICFIPILTVSVCLS
jgi:hypothetical protein